MKNNIITLTLFTLFLIIISCTKEGPTTPSPNKVWTEYDWKVMAITQDGMRTVNPEKDRHGNNIANANAYVLIFQNDSVFGLDLSVNQGGGSYKLINEQQISILGFNSYTEVCCDSDFDEDLLIPVMSSVVAYEEKDDILTFTGSKGEIEFKRQ